MRGGGSGAQDPGPGSRDWEGLKGRGVCGHKASETSGPSDRGPREKKSCPPRIWGSPDAFEAIPQPEKGSHRSGHAPTGKAWRHSRSGPLLSRSYTQRSSPPGFPTASCTLTLFCPSWLDQCICKVTQVSRGPGRAALGLPFPHREPYSGGLNTEVIFP